MRNTMPSTLAQPKKPVPKDEAWRRAALRYSLIIIIIGAIAGTFLALQIAGVEATEQSTQTVPTP